MLYCQVRPLGLFECTHPFGGLVILDFGELFEVATSNCIGLCRHLVGPEFRDSRGQVDHALSGRGIEPCPRAL